MIARTWRAILGGGVATLLLVAPLTMARAETSPATNSSSAATNPGKPAAKPSADAAKPKAKPAKIAAKPAAPHPATKLAAAKQKPEPAKKIAAAKRPEPTKTAAEAKPAPASYTITSTRGGVTTTTTRIVPAATTPAVTTAAAVAPAASAQIKPAAAKPAATQPNAAPAATQVASAAPAGAKPATTPVGPAAPAKPATFAAAATTTMTPVSAKLETPAVHLAPSDPKAATAFVSNFLVEAFHLAKSNGTSLQRRAQLADLFAGKMDMPRIAVYTTADELSSAPSDIQQRFRTILVSYLVETYYPQLELASDPTVKVETVAGEPLNDGTAVVWTTFTKEGWGSQSVKWHLQNEDGHYRIVDIFSAGASLVQMERDTFQSVMRNGGLNELMAKLDARTKQLATAATE